MLIHTSRICPFSSSEFHINSKISLIKIAKIIIFRHRCSNINAKYVFSFYWKDNPILISVSYYNKSISWHSVPYHLIKPSNLSVVCRHYSLKKCLLLFCFEHRKPVWISLKAFFQVNAFFFPPLIYTLCFL